MLTNSLYGTMLQDYYTSAAAEIMEKRRAELAAIDTPEAARAYVEKVREKYRSSFGPFPKKTALKPVIAAQTVRDGIKIDRLHFESRPGYKVSALFYRPEKFTGKLPGVLGVLGHSEDGFLSGAYQSYALGLAKKKFAVLMIEPAGQGERKQLWNTPGIKQSDLHCCAEHNHFNKQLLMMGDAFCNWRLWDGIRGLDYLLTRPEVDTTRVGVTGNSGGGTMTAYLWAYDDRFTMGASSCYITSFERNLDNELPVDAEQIIPGLAAKQFEMADMLIARAPHPFIMMGQSNDFFDIRGTAATYAEVSRIYRLLGAEENVRMFIGGGNHGYSQENREAMYGFFTEHACKRKSAKEPALVIPAPEELQVSPNRRVIDLPGAVSLPQIINKMTEKVQKSSGRGKASALRKYLAEAQQIAVPEDVPDYQVLRAHFKDDGTTVSRFGIRTEPGIRGFLHLYEGTPRGKGDIDEETGKFYFQIPAFDTMTLYVAHSSAEDELVSGMAVGEGKITALDVRGVGKSRPTTTDVMPFDVLASYNAEYFYDACGLLFDKPLPGGRANDVLAAAKLLKARGVKKLYLTGRGIGAVSALLASAAEPALFAGVKLYNMPLSYTAMCKRGITKWPQSAMPRNLLKFGDIADLAKMAKADILEPWDDNLQPMPAKQAEKDCLEK
ncbi:MAG: acetylxylan esterase [Lentisphaeria bacterium]|nr:acetylxylan esterase [Lentisphaeria bacterium]